MTKKLIVTLLTLMLFTLMVTTLDAASSADEKTRKKAVKLVSKGDKAKASQKMDKALEYYQKALAMEPNFAMAHLGIASLYMMQKKANEAFTHLFKAYANQGNDPQVGKELADILFRVGSSFVQQRKIKEANSFFEKLVAIPNIEALNKTNLAKTRYQLGTNYTFLKDYKKSNEQFLKFLSIPDLGLQFNQYVNFAHYMIGINYSSAREYVKSNEYLNKFLELIKEVPNDPRQPDATFIIGSNNYDLLEKNTAKIGKDKLDEIAKRAKANTNILPYFQKVVSGNARDVIKEQAYMKIGNYQYMCRELDQAITTYETLIQKFPNSADINSFKEFLKKLKDVRAKKEEAAKKGKKTSKKRRR